MKNAIAKRSLQEIRGVPLSPYSCIRHSLAMFSRSRTALYAVANRRPQIDSDLPAWIASVESTHAVELSVRRRELLIALLSAIASNSCSLTFKQ